MSKDAFLQQLESCLLMGSEEKDEVMNYYREYFEEAGSENEQAVIAELGDPVALADKLNREFEADLSGQDLGKQDANAETARSAESENGQSSSNRSGYYHDENRRGTCHDFSDLGASIGNAVKETVEAAMSLADVAIREAKKATEGLFDESNSQSSGETKGVFTSLKDIFRGGSEQLEPYVYTNDDMEPFTSAVVDVSNCPIRVERSVNGRFGVDVRLMVRPDDQVIVAVENGELTVKKIKGIRRLVFGFSGGSQHVKLYLPDVEYDRLLLDTSNASVVVSDVARIKELLNIDTSNGSIKVENVSVDDRIRLDTSNSSISVRQACCRYLEADSSNGGITVEQVSALEATLDTSNSGIKVKKSEIHRTLNADTSNGGIEVELTGRESDYRIVADTSNAKVHVNGRTVGSSYSTGGGNREVRLDTSNGRISIGFTA